MRTTGARLLVDCLLAQGATTIFGVPGESYLAVLDALHDVGDRVRLVPNRQEGGAGFMAAAWGKLTGAPGIAFVTRGPGATNAAIGVHTARQDSSPMILFVGQIARGMREREAFQEVDYRAAFGPLAKWATEIDDADRIPEIVARAFAVALSGRPGPVVVALPEDMLSGPAEGVPGPAVAVPKASPSPAEVAETLRLLAAAERPLILAGGGGWGAEGREGLRAFAEAAAIPVVTDFRCHDLIDNASPAYAGDAGLGKAPHVRALLGEADVLLAVGTIFGEIVSDGYSLFGVPRMAARLIHAHASIDELNRVHTADLPVAAHPDRLMPLLAAAAPPPSPARRARLAEAHAAWRASLATPPQPGGLDMGAVVRHLRGGAAAGRDPDQRRRQLRDLDQQAPAVHPRHAAARAAVGGDGLRPAGGDRGADRAPRRDGGLPDRRRRLPDDHAGARLRHAGRRRADRAPRQQPQLRHDPHAPGADLSGPGQLHRHREPRLRRHRPSLRPARRAG